MHHPLNTLLSMGTLAVVLLCPRAPAQSSGQPPIPTNPGSIFVHVNHEAVLSRQGNSAATTELARQLFRNIGIPPQLADAYGITARIATAHEAWRNGALPGISEATLVRSVNHLMEKMGTPQWACTNQTEVRKLRMRMVIGFPQLMAYNGPPDQDGHYKGVSDTMSPLQAAYTALTLVYQKVYNADYQFTPTEQIQNKTLSSNAVLAEHVSRMHALLDIVHGKTETFSTADLVSAGSDLFTDLGIAPTDQSSSSSAPRPGNAGLEEAHK